MAKKKYLKVCEGCLKEFTSNGNCPFCGCDRWRFIDSKGIVRHPVLEEVIRRIPDFVCSR